MVMRRARRTCAPCTTEAFAAFKSLVCDSPHAAACGAVRPFTMRRVVVTPDLRQ